MKFKDFPMHGLYKQESGYLWWWQYHVWTRRWYYLFGIPIWSKDFNDEDRPMYEFIKKATT